MKSLLLITTRLIASLLLQPACLLPLHAGVVTFSSNGNSYDAIAGNMTWDAASVVAQSMTYNGVQGHLATITSAAENLFITNSFGASTIDMYWIGGFQPAGSVEPAGGWTWVTGEAFVYNNWFPPNEPNNLGGQSRIMFAHPLQPDGKPWDDFSETGTGRGFVVEFENNQANPPTPPASSVPEPSVLWLLALVVVKWGRVISGRCILNAVR